MVWIGWIVIVLHEYFDVGDKRN